MVWLIGFLLQISNPAFAQPAATKAAAGADLTHAKLHIAGKIVNVEIADSDEKREKGLMFRKSLRDGDGMLFVFDQEQTLNFWMKNTLLDLAIGYFDSSKKLVDIQEMKSAAMELSPPPYPSKSPAMYALEVPKGWFRRNNVKVGETFSLDKRLKTASPRRRSSH